MKSLRQQMKERRLGLGLKQNDMFLRIGMSRQQYQYLESHGNPRLKTLELVAQALNSDLMLIPREKSVAVLAALEGKQYFDPFAEENDLSANPWKGLLGDTEDED